MKDWIKLIFALNPKLDALTYTIDKQVENLSTLTETPALALVDHIIKLNDKKVRIINLRVLHDKMKEALCDREYELILRLSQGRSFADMAEEFGMSKGHVYRLYTKIMQRLSGILTAYGYSTEKFDAEYRDITLVDRTLRKIAKCGEAS